MVLEACCKFIVMDKNPKAGEIAGSGKFRDGWR